MARTKQVARKNVAPKKVVAKKAPVKAAAKAPAKAPAKTVAKKAAPAKAPAKTKVVAAPEEVNYATMKVADLKKLLIERGLDPVGLKPALIARLEAGEETPEEETPEGEDEAQEEAETEEEEKVEEEVVEAPKGKKVAAKPKAAPKAKAAAKPKAAPKPKPEPKAKVAPKVTLPKPKAADVPDTTYTVDAKTLSALILKALEEPASAFWKNMFSSLEDYVAAEDEAEGGVFLRDVTEGEEPEEEKKVEKVAPKKLPVPPKTKVAAEAPKTNVAVPTKEVPEAEKPKMVVSFSEKYKGFVDPSNTYVIDPITQSVYAKVKDNKVVPLEDEDLPIDRFKVYKVEDDALPKQSMVDNLLKESQKFHTAKKEALPPALPPKKVAIVEIEEEEKVEEAEVITEEEGEEEGDDDGTEVEIVEEGEEVDVVEEVEAEEEELTEKSEEIDEATFSKFLQAQHSGEVSRVDHIAISKKAGIPVDVGKKILLQYQMLSDRYPTAVTSARAKKTQPKPSFGAEKTAAKPVTKRLIKKD